MPCLQCHFCTCQADPPSSIERECSYLGGSLQFCAKLGKFSFELAKMIFCGLQASAVAFTCSGRDAVGEIKGCHSSSTVHAQTRVS
jgi:hypothetical protein